MRKSRAIAVGLIFCAGVASPQGQMGAELGLPVHLQNGDETRLPISELIAFGEKVFTAVFTSQEGAGRPQMKGNGRPLTNRDVPLVFPFNYNRISGPDANSCSGCHNKPRVGGGGDVVANVFVLAQRFDFATFDPKETSITRNSVDERGRSVTPQNIGNQRKTVGLFGSGYIEMLARQITSELQSTRDRMKPGSSSVLASKGISFGVLTRRPDGTWDTSHLTSISALSTKSTGAANPPSLVIRPFHQAGNVISLREFTNTAFNQHHGIQSEERFGSLVDADGDGFVNELTKADITAVTVYQATLPVPGRLVSSSAQQRSAAAEGERLFSQIGCSVCHIPKLALTRQGWIYSEPNPFNLPGNVQVHEGQVLNIDLTDETLPGPRLRIERGEEDAVIVPAYTDFRLHDMTNGPSDPNWEPVDMNQPVGSDRFFEGNGRFLTRRLWGVANQHSFGHHGQFTTMREAILAHAGEGESCTAAFVSLPRPKQDSVIEFLKTLQVLPIGAKSLCVDDKGLDIQCPPPH